MDAAGIDLLLCPPCATAALPHFGARQFVLASSSSMLWNIAQLPAGVVPVCRVRADETERPAPRGLLQKLAAAVDTKSAGLHGAVENGVDVRHVELDAEGRSGLRRRRHAAPHGRLVVEEDGGVSDAQLGVPDLAVGHVEPPQLLRAEDRLVEVDGGRPVL